MLVADFTMKVIGVYVCDQKIASTACQEIFATLEGVERDRHVGFTKKAGVREGKFHPKGTPIFNARQWSAVSAEELAEIATKMSLPKIEAEFLGANLLFSGYERLTQLPPLTRIVFPSAATLLIYGENLPCRCPAIAMREKDLSLSQDADSLFVKSALGKRGIVGWVERAGDIRLGDEAKVYLPT